ncbi:MAG: GFA family protein [Pseudomonadota bacterium]
MAGPGYVGSRHTGRCLCGQVTLAIAADPLGARQCWCRDCQYLASGSPTVNVLFPEEAVRYSGEVSTLRMVADSGNTVERGFCPGCGTQLYSRTLEPKGQPMRVRAGTLDNRDVLPPQSYIWVSSAPDWASFDPALPKFSKGPGSDPVA